MIVREFKALYPLRPIPAETVDAWATSLRLFRYADVLTAVQELAEVDDWPSLAKIVSRTRDIMERRAQAAQELSRREAWKRASERGIEAGPRPQAVIPEEARSVLDQLRAGRIGGDPDRPTMARRRQLAELERQMAAEQAEAEARGYCCPLHGRRCEPPSELCCVKCSEARHPEHPPGVPCVVAVIESGTVPEGSA
jgi:hypothetical protein